MVINQQILAVKVAVLTSLVLPTAAQSTPGASFFDGGGEPLAGSYQLVDNYEPSLDFFGKFNYFSSADPTYGHVQYVPEAVAIQNGYTQITDEGTARMSVDSTNTWPRNGPGRPAVRLISDNTYTHGLFVLDLNHMPWGCGTWPAYWLLGPDWPRNGEIDIIEGVNTQQNNLVSLHSSENCSIAGSGQTGTLETSNCFVELNFNSGCGTTLDGTASPNNYGNGLNRIGGGVYVTEWTSYYVKHWWFPRGRIPSSITNGSPDPTEFGIPAVNQDGPCDIDSHFNNMSIIINTDFCGAFAGNVYGQYDECPQTPGASSIDSCVDYVGNNPSAFADAYWDFNSLRVYQLPQLPAASSTFSTTLSTVEPSAASTNTISKGQGASTSNLASSSYTGPLSSNPTFAPLSLASTSLESRLGPLISSTESAGAAQSCPVIATKTVWTTFTVSSCPASLTCRPRSYAYDRGALQTGMPGPLSTGSMIRASPTATGEDGAEVTSEAENIERRNFFGVDDKLFIHEDWMADDDDDDDDYE